MDLLVDYLQNLDYVSLGLVAMPITVIILIAYVLWACLGKNDTMPDDGSIGQLYVSTPEDVLQPESAQQLSPTAQLQQNNAYDCGILIVQNENQQNNGHGNQQNGHNNNAKQRKGRHNNKRQDGNNAAQKQRHAATDFVVENWLGNNMKYCYESRRSALYGGDDTARNHNPTHRNSNASETTSSELAKSNTSSSSSNEDLTADMQGNSKPNKKHTKSRSRRQHKNKQQKLKNGNNHAAANVATTNTKKEANLNNDESTKENKQPTSNANLANNQTHQQQRNKPAQNLRKQCTKAAALKCVNKTKTGNQNVNINKLTTSTSSASVCSVSSNRSVPSSVSSSASNSPTASPTVTKRYVSTFVPIVPMHMKNNITEQELVLELQRYVINSQLLRLYGFPVESSMYEGCTEIFKMLPTPTLKKNKNKKNFHPFVYGPNAGDLILNFINNEQLYQEYLDALNSSDSGQGSGTTSPDSTDSDASEAGDDENAQPNVNPVRKYKEHSYKRVCVRCNSQFKVTDSGEYEKADDECHSHWGKVSSLYLGEDGFFYKYSCCKRQHAEKGCEVYPTHVWTGADSGLNGPYSDYVYTQPSYDPAKPTKIYALDCEMSFTGRGLELTKITVIGFDGTLVYEHFVRPECKIVDYNTRYSGITADDLDFSNESVKTLPEVQRDLLQLFDANTILIGHGLDNDLRVLRMVHKTVVDTSISFPHAAGFPFRQSLKHLTRIWLNREIQRGKNGHNSYEDAFACLELMRWRVFNEVTYSTYCRPVY